MACRWLGRYTSARVDDGEGMKRDAGTYARCSRASEEAMVVERRASPSLGTGGRRICDAWPDTPRSSPDRFSVVSAIYYVTYR